MKSTGSSVWPYVIVGSAIGGAVGYLFMTESGRKIRNSITHPDELSNNLEDARNFVERKARVVNERLHSVMDKAKESIEEGERAYREAGQRYRSQVRQLESKNTEITSSVHNTIDKMSRTAGTVEESILDPVCEMGALFKGVERGIRALLGRSRERTLEDTPMPMEFDQRMMGS